MEENLKEKDFSCLLLKNQLCFPLYASSREILRKYTPFLKELGLTYTQYIVMMVMWEQKKVTIGELGKQLFLDTGTLSPLLKNMQEKGLLTRQREKNDERIVNIEITQAGEELKEKALSVPERVGACVNIDAEDAKELYRILYKILDQA